MKECSEIDCHYPIFSKGKCKYHMERKPLKRGKFINKRKEPLSSNNEMRGFFLSIWSKRVHRSEISNTWLGNEPLSTFFHHIILKSDLLYGELGKFDEENIILLSMEEHERVHNDMYLYEEINKRRGKLLEKYEKINSK